MHEPRRPTPAGQPFESHQASAYDYVMTLARAVPLNHALWRAAEATVLARVPMERPVLDIGCGDGRFALLLFRHPIDVGIDQSFQQLGKAQKTGAYLKLQLADATDMPFPAASFSTAFSNCVMEHIPDVDAVCREAARVLRPGGLFVFTVPNDHFGDLLLYPRLFRFFGGEGLARRYIRTMNRVFLHSHTDSLERWRARLAAADFEIIGEWQIVPPLLMAIWDFFMPIAAIQRTIRWAFPRWDHPIQRAFLRAARPLLEPLLRPGRYGGNMAIVARKRAD